MEVKLIYCCVSTQLNTSFPINGFLTPPSGPVNFELGVVAYDGDRQSTGDQMKFNGSGSFLNIQDPIHNPTNLFNSTIPTPLLSGKSLKFLFILSVK